MMVHRQQLPSGRWRLKATRSHFLREIARFRPDYRQVGRCMDDDVAKLRERAEQCIRLARLQTDARVKGDLEKLGGELEAEAVKIEVKRHGISPPLRPTTRP